MNFPGKFIDVGTRTPTLVGSLSSKTSSEHYSTLVINEWRSGRKEVEHRVGVRAGKASVKRKLSRCVGLLKAG